MKHEFFYISNLISFSRFFLTAVCAYFLINEIYSTAGIMIIIIWLSDLLDGYAARKRNEVSELGKLVDPIADKTAIFVISMIMLLKGIVPLWFIIVVISRDIIILCGGLILKRKKHVVLQSNIPGKVTVFIIGLTLLAYLISSINFLNFFSYHNEFTELLLWVLQFLSLVMIVFSIISYFKRFLTEFNRI